MDYLPLEIKALIAMDFGEAITETSPRMDFDSFMKLCGFERADRPRPERKRKARRN